MNKELDATAQLITDEYEIRQDCITYEGRGTGYKALTASYFSFNTTVWQYKQK